MPILPLISCLVLIGSAPSAQAQEVKTPSYEALEQGVRDTMATFADAMAQKNVHALRILDNRFENDEKKVQKKFDKLKSYEVTYDIDRVQIIPNPGTATELPQPTRLEMTLYRAMAVVFADVTFTEISKNGKKKVKGPHHQAYTLVSDGTHWFIYRRPPLT